MKNLRYGRAWWVGTEGCDPPGFLKVALAAEDSKCKRGRKGGPVRSTAVHSGEQGGVNCVRGDKVDGSRQIQGTVVSLR